MKRVDKLIIFYKKTDFYYAQVKYCYKYLLRSYNVYSALNCVVK